jgi:hypothetical protein
MMSQSRAMTRRVPAGYSAWIPPLIAACGAAAVWLLGWRGTDVAASTYRVAEFRLHGWLIWDNGWYGGHYPLSYSVLFPPFAARFGLYGTAILSVAVAAWAFGRLMEAQFGSESKWAVMLFAFGLAVPVAIGQLPFLAGAAVGLSALLATRTGWRAASVILAAGCALFSPVSGAFLALAFATWALTDPTRRRQLFALAGVAATPVVAIALLFPGAGRFPFLGVDLGLILGGCAVGLLVIPREHRELRVGLVVYALVACLLFVVPNPMGANYARLGVACGPAVLVALGISHRRRVLVLLALPVLIWQWSPAISVTGAQQDASHNADYFAPVTRYLSRQSPIGRIEIPPTRDHWEAAYVATQVPLARGWERQLDTSDNPIFYTNQTPTPSAYQRWLYNSGVTWIALPDAPLDYAALTEAHLLNQPQSFLRPEWHNAHWRVWKVIGGSGLATGPARVISLQPDGVVVSATSSGISTIRVRYNRTWTVESGNACIRQTDGPWIELVIRAPGRIDLSASLLGRGTDCEAAPRSN